MEEKQEGEREIVRKEGTERRSSEVGAKTEPATTFSVAEEATIASEGNNRACSNGGSREDKYGSDKRARTGYRGSS